MEQSLDWLNKQMNKVEAAPYGWTKETVEHSLQYQKDIRKEIDEYQTNLSKGQNSGVVMRKSRGSDRDQHDSEVYNKLNQISSNKIDCLENIKKIVAMQDLCVEFSRKVDACAVDLVQKTGLNQHVEEGNNSGFISTASQDCIFATRDSWNWLLRLVGCIDTHMKNVSEYQQFYHEVDECVVWMRADLDKLVTAFTLGPVTAGNQGEDGLRTKLQDIVTAFRQWETKTDFLWSRALKLVPVHMRTKTLENPAPARVIADYKGPDYSVRTDEDVLLLNMDDAHLWRVRNAGGQEGVIPSITVVIPGPDRDALEAAARLRIQLLAAWTNTLKTVGKRLLLFLLTVFKAHYDDEQISTLHAISLMDRQDLMRSLTNIENSLLPHWKDHEGFQVLQERLLMLRMILGTTDSTVVHKEGAGRAVIVQITSLETLLTHYQWFWRKWETFKTALETSRAPELMLVVERWEQLKFISTEEFSKYWLNQLPFDDDERRITGIGGAVRVSEESDTELVNAVNRLSGYVFSADTTDGCHSEDAPVFEDGGARGRSSLYGSETNTARTEHLSSAEGEESRRFVIKSVVDPATGDEISLKDSIRLGIIKPDEGVYVNTKTNAHIPIPEAMSQGLIKVTFSTVSRGEEKTSTVGIITVKTVRVSSRPYVVKTVMDTATNEKISKEDAEKRRILAIDLGVVKCTKTGKEYCIPEATEKGIIDIEYTGPKPNPKIIEKSYAVRAAVDRRTNRVISFQDAVVWGIIGKDSGEFKDTATGETMHIDEAIMKGFLQARKIDTPNEIHINPEDKMVVDNTKNMMRTTILRDSGNSAKLSRHSAIHMSMNRKDKSK